MAVYRIQITMPDGRRSRCTGLYANGVEAVLQALADFPGARGISAIFLFRRPV